MATHTFEFVQIVFTFPSVSLEFGTHIRAGANDSYSFVETFGNKWVVHFPLTYCPSALFLAGFDQLERRYLGYINGRELYPDMKFIGFDEFVDELIEGNVRRPYPHVQL